MPPTNTDAAPSKPSRVDTLLAAPKGLRTNPTATLENLTRQFLPPSLARLAKRVSVGHRYRAQLSACRRGFKEHGSEYTQRILFVAGLPKSGTTWLEKMIASFPGFHEVLIPEVAAHELATGGSHDFDLPPDMFSRFDDMLVLSKMHVHGSKHNVEVLKKADVRHVVLFRDLRDVAVSNFFYVRNTPWHPEYPHYAGKDIPAGLLTFALRTLGPYADWVRSWHDNRDPERSLVIRYEEMLADAVGCMNNVATIFDLPRQGNSIAELVDRFSFKKMSGGRDRGQQNEGQFVRKGVAGDWVNHFTPDVKSAFKDIAGQFLIDFGYEKNLDW